MPYLTLTLTENLKLQLSPGLVASYDIQPGNGEGLFWDKHTHVYLLTYLPRTHTGLGGLGECYIASPVGPGEARPQMHFCAIHSPKSANLLKINPRAQDAHTKT